MPLDRERMRGHAAGVPALFAELLADTVGMPQARPQSGMAPVTAGETTTPAAAEAPAATPRQQFERCAPADRPAWLHGHVTAQVARVLRLPRGESVPADESLLALGMDSLMAVELRNGLRRHWGVDIPFARFLQGLSVGDIVAELMATLGVSATPERGHGDEAVAEADADWTTGSI
jgi:acyl carrier protein